MTPGKLDRKITLERFTATPDDFNGQTETWTTLAEVWANFKQEPNNESFTASQTLAQSVAKFTIRYDPALEDLNAKDRINGIGRVWNIRAVSEVSREAFVEITAITVDDGA